MFNVYPIIIFILLINIFGLIDIKNDLTIKLTEPNFYGHKREK